MVSHPGITLRRRNPSLLSPKPSDWRQFIQIYGAPETDDVVSLGDQYFVSLGAHVDATLFLMERSASKPLDLSTATLLSTLLAYNLDQPVVPVVSETNRGPWKKASISPGNRALHRLVDGGVRGYFEGLGDVLMAASRFGVNRDGRRSTIYPTIRSTPDRWAFVSLPTTDLTWRLLSVYWAGLLSTLLPSRILSFWRVFEAAIPKANRLALFQDLHRVKVHPVWGQWSRRASSGQVESERRVNLMSRLRVAAIRQRDHLVAVYGSPSGALDHLYWTRRGKAAHADKSAAEFDQAGELFEQAKDAELLRYMARAGLERIWA